jgi:hypothetical protein
VCGREERKYEVLGRTIEGVCESERGAGKCVGGRKYEVLGRTIEGECESERGRGSVWEGGEEV